MNLSLGKFFKKEKGDNSSAGLVAAPLEKPASERLSKTVLPSGSRAVEPEAQRQPFNAPALKPISLGAPLVPAPVAFTPAPGAAADKTVTLSLSDLLPQIPDDLLQKAEVDPEQQLIFKAAELERGMSNGRPAVRLRSIYQQVPGIFASEVAAQDEREVALPLHQLLQQFASPQFRPGQTADHASPPVSAPQTIAPPKLPPLAPIRLSMPSNSQPAPAPVKISPHGTGAPATERVPASSGSPVPTPLPAPFAPVPAARAFKLPPLANDPFSTLLPPIKLTSPEHVEEAAYSGDGPRLHVSLRAIARGIPPFQFTGKLEEIPETAQIEVPIAAVLPQLSLGRVAISPIRFHAAVPAEYRPFFKMDDGGLPISLPLAEVLQNLPNDSLRLRSDQQEVQIGEIFETPFSQKAAEDAARLKVAAEPVGKVPDAEELQLTPPTVEAAPERTALQAALDTDETPLDAKTVVAHISRLPGVRACAVVFSDGLSLASNISADDEAEALCAIAPEVIKSFAERMRSANFGAVESVTLFCAKAPVSFFAHDNICLAAMHSEAEISAGIRGRLGRITEELAAIYAQPDLTPNA